MCIPFWLEVGSPSARGQLSGVFPGRNAGALFDGMKFDVFFLTSAWIRFQESLMVGTYCSFVSVEQLSLNSCCSLG